MSGLLYLEQNDFQISVGPTSGKPLLCNRISGFSLIMFYSPACTHCKHLLPIFKKLPGTIEGCQFGVVNVSQNRKCIEMSNQTITPIKFVPFIMLYSNGIPFMAYDGPQQEKEICRFVVDVARNMQKNQQFVLPQNSNAKITKPTDSAIPAYCIGVPLNSNKVCYLDFTHAYDAKPK